MSTNSTRVVAALINSIAEHVRNSVPTKASTHGCKYKHRLRCHIFDGNMTSDGTNSYTWDAENRMVKITYAGTGNYSTFGYDGYGQNILIVETAAGSVTSAKQFVWSKDSLRPYQSCEERDGSGTV